MCFIKKNKIQMQEIGVIFISLCVFGSYKTSLARMFAFIVQMEKDTVLQCIEKSQKISFLSR